MSERDDWEKWQRLWLSTTVRSETPAMRGTTRSQRVRRDRTAIMETLIAAAGTLLLIGAMRHAANATELTLGSLAIVGIGVAWTTNLLQRRRESAAIVRDTPGYIAELRLTRTRQLGLARFIWIVLALELVFLVRWWIGGFAVHRHSASSPIALATFWTPLVALGALGWWATRLGRRARAELRRIDMAGEEFGAR